MLDPKFVEEVLESGWVESTIPDGKISRGMSFDFKLKDGAPESIAKKFYKLKGLVEWGFENNKTIL